MRLFCFSTLIFSTAISANPLASQPLSNLKRVYQATPDLGRFDICQGGGCSISSTTQITYNEWLRIVAIFEPESNTALEERERIAEAIGLFEEIVGVKVGTSTDLAGTFNGDYKGQQDCNDEAVNTKTYLKLLKQNGLIIFHTLDDLRTRNFFITAWPHTTASIKEIKTDELFAVDSWFYHNGHPAVVIPLETWEDNFRPSDSPIYQKDAD